MKKLSLIFFIALVVSGLLFYKEAPVKAENQQEKLDRLGSQISEYTQKITELRAKAGTLANQIAQFDAQIRLTELKIDQTQEQIILLGGRIDQLQISLEDLKSAFSQRAVETYRMSRLSDSALILFSAPDINKAVSRYHYLKRIQESDRKLLEKLEKARTSYVEQKDELVELEAVLGVQKEELDGQKAAKNHLLAETKNDEAKYQDLLAQAKAEFEAIQAIIAGKGDETEVRKVSKGERIASIIQGPSCNSNGTHLHFIVSQNAAALNPFTYLKPIDYENCSGSSCGSGDGDAFDPNGSWDWPISAPIKFSQGFGYTWAVQNSWVGRIYQFHNGIDVNSGDSSVRAVQAGVLFQGSYTGSDGCRLRYVRVHHDEGGLDTFYLHINF